MAKRVLVHTGTGTWQAPFNGRITQVSAWAGVTTAGGSFSLGLGSTAGRVTQAGTLEDTLLNATVAAVEPIQLLLDVDVPIRAGDVLSFTTPAAGLIHTVIET